MQRAGVDERWSCDYSFRIGAVTTVAQKGLEDCIIKTLGRWESVEYLQYVKIPRSVGGVLRVTGIVSHHRAIGLVPERLALSIESVLLVSLTLGAHAQRGLQ